MSNTNHPASTDHQWANLETLEPRIMLSGDVGPVAWDASAGGNNHSYEVVMAPAGISWTDAQADAQARGGYLATVTSQDENSFIFQLIDNPDFWNVLPFGGGYALGPWIGGFKDADFVGAPNEGWEWVTGEEWNFANWDNLEPDRLDQHYVHYYGRGAGEVTDEEWANWMNNDSRFPIISYVVEYEASNEAPSFTSEPDTNAYTTQQYSYTITTEDADGDELAINGALLPDWMTLTDNGDGTATLTGTPTADQIGAHDIVLELTDGSETVQQSFTLNVATVGQISGTVWHDLDADGVIDEGENLLAGWRVYEDANSNGLFDDGEAFVLTGDDGGYVLEEVQPGEHNIRAAAPHDDSALGDFMIHASWQNTLLPLAEHESVQRTQIDENTFELAFEDWTDGDYNDLVLRISHDDMGRWTMEVMGRDAAGRFDLVDADTQQRILFHLGHHQHNPVGTTFDLAAGWQFVGGGGLYELDTDAGMIVQNADFGVQLATGQTAPEADVELTGSLSDYHVRAKFWFINLDLPLHESLMVQRTNIDSDSYYLGFEDFIDFDYNDLTLQVDELDNGAVMLTVVDRDASAHFSLVDSSGQTVLSRLGENNGAPDGTTILIGSAEAPVSEPVDWQLRLSFSHVPTPLGRILNNIVVTAPQADDTGETATDQAVTDSSADTTTGDNEDTTGTVDVLAMSDPAGPARRALSVNVSPPAQSQSILVKASTLVRNVHTGSMMSNPLSNFLHRGAGSSNGINSLFDLLG